MTSRLEVFLTPSKKIDKPLVVYRFSGNVMKWRFLCHTYGNTLTFSPQKYDFKIILMAYDK